VKKKDDKSGGGGSPDVLNRLLELIEGTETIGNVKVFCTTNHVEMIEEAIRSRFSEIYLGKSNTVLRRDFVVWYLMRTKGKKD
jgi:AAA+ superfamily predicted ATPase